MKVELKQLRSDFGRFLLWLLWAHVPLLIIVAYLHKHSPILAGLAGVVLAGSYHVMWHRNGATPATRYLSSVALIGEPALLLLLLSGNAWQMDMHMYFFAMLAVTIGWCDRRATVIAATVVAAHHLILLYLLPSAVFPGMGSLERVILHAVIVVFQTLALVWVINQLVESFTRNRQMSNEILAKNAALEERTAEAEEANRAKSMFLANMSHEIRTPMNAILGFCHLVSRTDLNSKQQDYIGKINQAGASLLRLINDILDFSKNEAGKLTLEENPFNLRTAVENQIQMVSSTAHENQVQITANFADTIPTSLLGDELRFNQVVLNLLSNAVKFTKNGTVTINVDVISLDDENAHLQVAVRDTGIGMTLEQQTALFQSFTQADSSTTRRFGGTGLGLAISRQIVEQMDGTIRVDSIPNEGSTFTCRMRFAIDTSTVEEALEFPEHLSKLHILAADDNPASRQLLAEMVKEWGLTIDLVASGSEALAAIQTADQNNTPYDLVLLDWKMPGLDGMQTVEAMHGMAFRVRAPKTIMITAYGANDLNGQTKVADVAAFLTKPLAPKTLLETLIDIFPLGSLSTSQEPIISDLPSVSSQFQGLSILLVEDNEINREIAIEILSDAGLKVDYAENGVIACQRIAERGADYALVLMDVQMPEMDGITATKIIRETWSSEKLPILAMTAHAYEEEKQRCFSAGMNDHIPKPIDPAGLVQTLNRWLNTERPASPSAKAPAAPQETATLPDNLPPFDIPAALKRVNGRAPLLRKLIITFAATYEHVSEELRGLIAQPSLPDARRLAHSLKGVAGSLELPAVQEHSSKVEQHLAQEDVVAALKTIELLEAAITPAIIAAKSLTAASAGAPVVAAPTISAQDNFQALQDLRSLVYRRSLSARSGFQKYAEKIGLSETDRMQHPLYQALEKLDYDAALALIDAASSPTKPQDLESHSA